MEPLTFNLQALEENADCTRGLPLQTHRGGLTGKLVLATKQAFRAGAQVFINEALGRQRLFNAHVRDSYAQLSAEVMRLREEVARLSVDTSPVAEQKRRPKGRAAAAGTKGSAATDATRAKRAKRASVTKASETKASVTKATGTETKATKPRKKAKKTEVPR